MSHPVTLPSVTLQCHPLLTGSRGKRKKKTLYNVVIFEKKAITQDMARAKKPNQDILVPRKMLTPVTGQWEIFPINLDMSENLCNKQEGTGTNCLHGYLAQTFQLFF